MNIEKMKMKPVWRTNAGKCVPSDFEPPTKMLIRKVNGVSAITSAFTPSKLWGWNSFYLNLPVIAAYQTNRTKAAKYERVDCFECFNRSRYADNTDKSGCKVCKGQGHTREFIK